MKTKVVTSFNQKLWDKYAQKTLSTWVKHLKLDEGSIVEVWINGPFPEGLPVKTESGIPFVYKLLDTQSTGWLYFYNSYRNVEKPETAPGQEFKFNFVPFSCKVFALAEAAYPCKYQGMLQDGKGHGEGSFDTFLWLDADVRLTKDVTSSYLAEVLGNSHLAWLDRGEAWGYGETGFILARTENDVLDIFLNQANMWGSGQLFYLKEWHDAFTLSSCVSLKQFTDQEHFIVNNLNKDMNSEHKNGLYPFETSILSTHMEHYKGNLKDKLGGNN